MSSTGPSVAERAIELFRRLAEEAALSSGPIQDLSSYEHVIWFADASALPACYSRVRDGLRDDQAEIWLEISRPDEPILPEPPELCRNWYSESVLADDSAHPALFERIRTVPENPACGTPARYAALRDHPEVEAAWRTYLGSDWNPWALKHGAWRSHQGFYRLLHAAAHAVQSNEAPSELIAAFGLLSWASPVCAAVRRHVITTRADLSIDAASGAITVRLPFGSASATLEDDTLAPPIRPPAGVTHLCQRLLSESPSVLGRGEWLAAMLVPWVRALDNLGTYTSDLRPPRQATSLPIVAFAPALIVRPRRTATLAHWFDAVAESIRRARDDELSPLLGRFLDSGCEAPPHSAKGGVLLLSQGRLAGPDVQRIAAVVSQLLAQRERMLITGPSDGALTSVRELVRERSAAQRLALREAVRRLRQAMSSALRAAPEWAEKSLADALRGTPNPALEFLAKHEAELARLCRQSRAAFARAISVPAGVDRSKIQADVSGLLEHVRAGGGMGLGPFAAAAARRARYVLRSVRVDGHPCDDETSLRELLGYLDAEASLAGWQRRWEDVLGAPLDVPLQSLSAELERQLTFLRKAKDVVLALRQVREAAAPFCKLELPDWGDPAAVAAFNQELDPASGRLPAIIAPIGQLSLCAGTAPAAFDVAVVVDADRISAGGCALFHVARSLVACVKPGAGPGENEFVQALYRLGSPFASRPDDPD